eukprot:Gregarina_sp_Poly_1__4484@NODE_240_length_10883_cov_144_711446_g211_i0_p6_GENE_NODE_240_length_10883_cov_144_711446_g211_i0NODE_240_length_10883_cov_144_711446_g211_i0_p6_ORF_typecomplete_len151_score3_43Ribosomal_S27e/PF01667_17/6_1e02Ribosomal_S27e/PF01667_17/1_4e27zfCSL/PF05207_13/0_061FYVE_2/PF02318_16/3e02FYVE_2/PF02318_16/0_04_NODE_240_length_10883_cov_144_711446_g211_i0178630
MLNQTRRLPVRQLPRDQMRAMLCQQLHQKFHRSQFHQVVCSYRDTTHFFMDRALGTKNHHRGWAELSRRKMARDLAKPSQASELRKHKLKRLVPSPNSFFMDVRCEGCFTITTVFSHAQTVVVCKDCSTILCRPSGGKCQLSNGCHFRKK